MNFLKDKGNPAQNENIMIIGYENIVQTMYGWL
jgi:hypothetical protein